MAWTGEADLAALFAASPRPRVEDPDDAALLRRLRAESTTGGRPPLFLEHRGALFEVGVADVLPLDVELYDDRGGLPWQ